MAVKNKHELKAEKINVKDCNCKIVNVQLYLHYKQPVIVVDLICPILPSLLEAIMKTDRIF